VVRHWPFDFGTKQTKYIIGTPETYIYILFVHINMNPNNIGDSPSGKALVSGTSIRGFESLIPSQA
jgi:hypothetical protein